MTDKLLLERLSKAFQDEELEVVRKYEILVHLREADEGVERGQGRVAKPIRVIIIAAILMMLFTVMASAAVHFLNLNRVFVNQYGISNKNEEQWQLIDKELSTDIEEISAETESGTMTIKQMIRDGRSLYFALEFMPVDGIELTESGNEYLIGLNLKGAMRNGKNLFDITTETETFVAECNWEALPVDNQYPIYVQITLPEKFASNEIVLELSDISIVESGRNPFVMVEVATGPWSFRIPLDSIEQESSGNNIFTCDVGFTVDMQVLENMDADVSSTMLQNYKKIVKSFTIQSFELTSAGIWIDYFGRDYIMVEDGVDKYWCSLWKLPDGKEEEENAYIKEQTEKTKEEFLRQNPEGKDSTEVSWEPWDRSTLIMEQRELMLESFLKVAEVRFKDGSIETLHSIYSAGSPKETAGANLDGTGSTYLAVKRPILVEQIECIIINGIEYTVNEGTAKERRLSDKVRLDREVKKLCPPVG